jgi:hypothetical protein
MFSVNGVLVALGEGLRVELAETEDDGEGVDEAVTEADSV